MNTDLASMRRNDLTVGAVQGFLRCLPQAVDELASFIRVEDQAVDAIRAALLNADVVQLGEVDAGTQPGADVPFVGIHEVSIALRFKDGKHLLAITVAVDGAERAWLMPSAGRRSSRKEVAR